MANAATFRRNLRVRLDQALGPAARSRLLAQTARQERDRLIAEGRAPASFRRFVDGHPDTSEDTVRGDGRGVILYQFSYTAEAAVFALAYLQGRAPIESGRFRRSFFVGVNGRFIRAEAFRPEQVPADAELIIGNSQPYNRKIDVQEIGSRTQVLTWRRLGYAVPPNLYADAGRAVRRRFGNSVDAYRVHDIDFPGKYRLQQAQVALTGRRTGRVYRRAGQTVQSPALIISPRN